MKRGYLIGGIVFLVAAVFAGWACLHNFNLMQASSDWTKTQGKIIKSDVQNLTVGRKENYKAWVEYGFTVGGNMYHGSRVRFADTSGSSEDTQRSLAAQYPVGATVDVYYDPADPKLSVLEPGGGARAYGLLLPPLIPAGIGAILLIDGRRKSQRKL